MIIDIHHHGSVPPESITSVSIEEEIPSGEGFLSVGIHPWKIFNPFDLALLDARLHDPRVVALGEAGVDKLRGASLSAQIEIFKAQISLSEKYQLPLIIHCVKAADIISGLKNKLRPSMPWILHGFRGKPGQAQQLIRSGIKLSFGEKFNPDTLLSVPDEELLVETDVSALGINEIISLIAETRGQTPEYIRKTVMENATKIFGV